MAVASLELEIDGWRYEPSSHKDDSEEKEKNRAAVPSGVCCKVLYTRGAGIEICAEDNSTPCGNEPSNHYCKLSRYAETIISRAF
ncbi:hypothetical protein AGABI2DRAFT_114805 [Agaricus bisporus var. bisporus H97]|uniref:hypothetical protein n=1 Tax=Agaricus bisporus var. bisporus (strain H97 / ATCC MYA-4626 / FGSC 10389) TaxID=936046 RepID=UPI00029F636A|nr:hypothetical protein AGABI2DRAFT_114805 [Agaricus bisporus var. bisporus H97]EKV49720.1 hypothetical protein AGABI2DRAFT_114805 [Agaricus bisporus var. bisporus H97]